MKRILIVDDHSSVRKGVKQILSDEFTDAEFGESSNGAEALTMARLQKWDLIVLDIDMPGRNGLEVLRQLRAEGLKIPVLVFSIYPEIQFAVRALKNGAMGYVCKSTLDKDLIEAAVRVISGKRYITQEAAEILVSQMENPVEKLPHELLSDREYQAFILLAKGKGITEIANELSLSIPTVSTYRLRILEKMCLQTNADLTLYAYKNGLMGSVK